MRLQAIITDDTLGEIDARAGTRSSGLGRSVVVEEALSRYFTLLALARLELRDRFSRAELSLMADAANGTMYQAETLRFFPMGVADAIDLDGLDRKWDVNAPLLLTKLRDLSVTQTAALVDAVERFWRDPAGREPGGLLD